MFFLKPALFPLPFIRHLSHSFQEHANLACSKISTNCGTLPLPGKISKLLQVNYFSELIEITNHLSVMVFKNPGSKTRQVQLDLFLYTRSVFAFILFFGLALWAFWTSYYGKLHEDMAWSMRFHGMAMTAWCLMLILQPLLIRLQKNKLHRLTGKLSYIIAPLIVITGAHLAQITVRDMEAGTALYYFWIALMFISLLAFAILYGLAMWNRKKPLIHARYMVCTIFPLFTPITDRLIYKYFPELISLVPMLEDMPLVQLIGFALADILLITLLIWDWMAHKRLNVFPVVLLVMGIFQLSVLTFYKFSLWKQIGNWIMSLPLS
jgi:hypothetical membrane protein